MTSLLQNLDDSVRLPAELLLDYLREKNFIPKEIRVSPENALLLYFEKEREDGVTLTADVEIEDGSVASASVIPFAPGEKGLEHFTTEEEPLDLWEIEEEPPYPETVRRIMERFDAEPAEIGENLL